MNWYAVISRGGAGRVAIIRADNDTLANRLKSARRLPDANYRLEPITAEEYDTARRGKTYPTVENEYGALTKLRR